MAHVTAALLIIVGLFVRVAAGDAFWGVLLSEALVVLGLFWFLLPLFQRLERFVKRSRGQD